jgi:hypothetical protein
MSVEQRKVPFTGFLEVRQLAEIDRLSKAMRKTKAEILREAMDEYLSARQPAVPASGLQGAANGGSEAVPSQPRGIWSR